jgi:hypothetical protein
MRRTELDSSVGKRRREWDTDKCNMHDEGGKVTKLSPLVHERGGGFRRVDAAAK